MGYEQKSAKTFDSYLVLGNLSKSLKLANEMLHNERQMTQNLWKENQDLKLKVHVNPNFQNTFLTFAVKFSLYFTILRCFQLIFLDLSKRNSLLKTPTQCEQSQSPFCFL